MRRLLVSLSPSEEQDQERNGLRDALQKETPGSTTALVALPKCSKMALKLCSLPILVHCYSRPLFAALGVPFSYGRNLRPELAGAIGDDASTHPVEDHENDDGAAEQAAVEAQQGREVASGPHQALCTAPR